VFQVPAEDFSNSMLLPVVDPAMGGPGGRPFPIDQNLGLVMAA